MIVNLKLLAVRFPDHSRFARYILRLSMHQYFGGGKSRCLSCKHPSPLQQLLVQNLFRGVPELLFPEYFPISAVQIFAIKILIVLFPAVIHPRYFLEFLFLHFSNLQICGALQQFLFAGPGLGMILRGLQYIVH